MGVPAEPTSGCTDASRPSKPRLGSVGCSKRNNGLEQRGDCAVGRAPHRSHPPYSLDLEPRNGSEANQSPRIGVRIARNGRINGDAPFGGADRDDEALRRRTAQCARSKPVRRGAGSARLLGPPRPFRRPRPFKWPRRFGKPRVSGRGARSGGRDSAASPGPPGAGPGLPGSESCRSQR
jgi:hypothetical protein